MSLLQWVIVISVTFIAFLPLTRLKIFNISKRYLWFKYVSIFLFIWTITSLLSYVVESPIVNYYLTISIYPNIFILTVLLFVSIMFSMEKKIPKAFIVVTSIVAIFEIFIVVTNPMYQLLLELAPTASLTLADFYPAPHGPLFYVHTVICYTYLMLVFVILFRKLISNFKKDSDGIPLIMMSGGIVLGVSINMIHVFVHPFIIDPTYLAFVLIITLLYFVFYIRDIRLIIELDRNNFILENFREMYVLCNHRNIVVGASDEFIKRFDVDIEKDLSFEDLMDHIKDKTVIYNNSLETKGEFQEGKRYLYMESKRIHLPLFKREGLFYLFFDETKNQKYMNDMAYVKSHDLMTGLYNRNYFEELKMQLDEKNPEYSLMMLDLDGFKYYNDQFGHAQGDALLIRFANELLKISKKFDLKAIRMGGDEFLLMSLKSPKLGVCSKVVEEIIKISKSSKNEEEIKFSYGLAVKSTDTKDVESVLLKADKIMYEMKSKHKLSL